MQHFDVALIGDCAPTAIDGNPVNWWLSEPEVMARRCYNGRPVSETIKRLLQAIAPASQT
jgi:hypothetical protein